MLFCWFSRRVSIQERSVIRVLLMLPASRKRSPLVLVRLFLSEPARSTKESWPTVKTFSGVEPYEYTLFSWYSNKCACIFEKYLVIQWSLNNTDVKNWVASARLCIQSSVCNSASLLAPCKYLSSFISRFYFDFRHTMNIPGRQIWWDAIIIFPKITKPYILWCWSSRRIFDWIFPGRRWSMGESSSKSKTVLL